MAKIWGIPHNRRAKKFKNHLVIKNTSLGGYVAASWPRKGWYDNSPAGRERASIFGQVQSWTRRPHPLAQIDAIEGSEGTMYLPRDLLTKCAYGKLTEIHWKDGTVTYPVKLMSEEAQALLNSISITPGAILIRTASQWVGIEPGSQDTILTSQGPDAVPKWAPPQAGAGGNSWTQNTASSDSSTQVRVMKGRTFYSFTSLTLQKVAVSLQLNGTYKFRIAAFLSSNDVITEVLFTTGVQSMSGEGYSILSYAVPPTFISKDVDHLGVGILPEDGKSAEAIPIHFSASEICGNPFFSETGQGFYLDKAPEVGDTLTRFTGPQYWIALGI